ncbi:hypothetical protein Q9966_012296 [Columba livia]|nr:hypothetical protein Q9966_012296 [Columba livia]
MPAGSGRWAETQAGTPGLQQEPNLPPKPAAHSYQATKVTFLPVRGAAFLRLGQQCHLLTCSELPPRQTPLRTVVPVQRRKTSTFEDGDDDDLLDVLRRGKGPKKEEELRPARSTLDDLFGRGSVAKVLEKPGTGEHREFKVDKKSQKQAEEEERKDKKELVFGEYKPSMGSRPAVQPAMGQLVRRAKEQAKEQEKTAEPTETQEKKAKPSETEEKKAEPSETQEKENEPSEAQDTKAEPSETVGEGLGPCSPGSQLAASPAASDCRAELLSAQARVAELESQVRMLEEERAQQQVLLESAQRQHQEHLDVQESSHSTKPRVLLSSTNHVCQELVFNMNQGQQKAITSTTDSKGEVCKIP